MRSPIALYALAAARLVAPEAGPWRVADSDSDPMAVTLYAPAGAIVLRWDGFFARGRCDEPLAEVQRQIARYFRHSNAHEAQNRWLKHRS